MMRGYDFGDSAGWNLDSGPILGVMKRLCDEAGIPIIKYGGEEGSSHEEAIEMVSEHLTSLFSDPSEDRR